MQRKRRSRMSQPADEPTAREEIAKAVQHGEASDAIRELKEALDRFI
jgi:hypothetical protein